MLTEKDYCDLDTSHELWVMGLEPEAYYDGPIILLYEAQKWLREEKEVEVNALWDRIAEKWYFYINFMYYPDLMGIEVTQSIYDSYEEALSEGIKETVKILKDGIGK